MTMLNRKSVFYVTERRSLPGASIEALCKTIRMATTSGCDFVQIREKDLSAKALLELTQNAVGMAERTGRTRVIVNDRLDVALAAGAAGVHLTTISIPAREVIPWCRRGNAPADFLIGVSCHNVEETRIAEQDGASYVFFGPIFDTPSKRSFGPPQGLANLAHVCRTVKIPVIAIGGVNEESAAECIRAGAAGIAAIRMFQDSHETKALALAVSKIHGTTRT